MITNTNDSRPAGGSSPDQADQLEAVGLKVPIQHPSHEQLGPAVELVALELRELTANSNFGDGGWQLVSLSNDWVFRNDQDQLIARVARDQHGLEEVDRQLDLARRLVAAGVLAVPPASNSARRLPMGRYVSFWQLAEDRLKPGATELAGLAGNWHQTRPIAGLKPWWPQTNFDFQHKRLEALVEFGLSKKHCQQLSQLLEQRWQRLLAYEAQPGGYGLMHGDFWHANVVRLGGQLRLCDLEAVALGPREKDMSAIAVDLNHYLAEPDAWGQFLNHYRLDYDPRRLELFIDVQEITDLMWLAGFWQRSPASRQELARRLDNFTTPNYQWTLPLGATYHQP